jgi:hypothetical protein
VVRVRPREPRTKARRTGYLLRRLPTKECQHFIDCISRGRSVCPVLQLLNNIQLDCLFHRTVYTRGLVLDGNFKLAHVKQRRPDDDIWLADGQAMVAEQSRYNLHIVSAVEEREVTFLPLM